MVNVNIRRIKIAGEIVRVMETRIKGVATYKVGIQKVDGGIWVVNISEELYFKTHGKEAIFELAMVFKDDNMYGVVDTELSKVEAVYVKGIDITDEEYASQEELDKSWLMTTENLETIHVEKKRFSIRTFGWIFLIAAVFTFIAVNSWIKNVDYYGKYDDYVMVEGTIIDCNYVTKDSVYWYDVEYTADDGNVYTHRESLKKIESKMPKTGDDVPIIYNPENPEDVYIGMHKMLPERYVPVRYAFVASSYLLGVFAIAFDLGAVALVLFLTNKKTSRLFRLLIPICLIVFSVITAIMCGMIYYVWAFVFTVVLLLMLFIRMKKNRNDAEESTIILNGEKL